MIPILLILGSLLISSIIIIIIKKEKKIRIIASIVLVVVVLFTMFLGYRLYINYMISKDISEQIKYQKEHNLDGIKTWNN